MKDTQDIDYEAFVIWVLVLAALSLPKMSIEGVSFWHIELQNNSIS